MRWSSARVTSASWRWDGAPMALGDHMSHYNVNASVPKTLIQHLIRWVARKVIFSPDASEVLLDILETEISPELIPGQAGHQPQQKTESVVGPL